MSVVLISTEQGTHREEACVASCLGNAELEKNVGRFNRSCENKKDELLPQKDSKQKYLNEDYIHVFEYFRGQEIIWKTGTLH